MESTVTNPNHLKKETQNMTHNLPAVPHISSRSITCIGSSEAFKKGLAAYNEKNYTAALTE